MILAFVVGIAIGGMAGYFWPHRVNARLYDALSRLTNAASADLQLRDAESRALLERACSIADALLCDIDDKRLKGWE